MQIDATRSLFMRTAVLYERNGTTDPERFNVFSVLRAESDEVNLHSRFLAALLSCRNSRDTSLLNLDDFLRTVADIDDFPIDEAKVERERYKIDILVHNVSAKQAVIIENKIGAPDQPMQLERYAKRIVDAGYSKPQILYLTLSGRNASSDSAGGYSAVPISYKDIVPWLERCQQRAYKDPALRESIAQYVHLVRKLTGTDLKGDYVDALKQLILENNNILLAHDLNQAMFEAKVALVEALWQEIDKMLRERIPDLPEAYLEWRFTQEDIRKFFSRQRGDHHHGLYYEYDGIGRGAYLAVEVEKRLYFGVYCSKEHHRREHNRLRKILDGLEGNDGPEDEWPWFKWVPGELDLRNPTRAHLEILGDRQGRSNYISEIAVGLSGIAEWIRK